MENCWNFKGTRYGSAADRTNQPLVYNWHLQSDWISDDYTPSEISASRLLDLWRRKLDVDTVPIHWIVECVGENAPFTGEDEDFLSFYGWPTHAVSGEAVNWLAVPVRDKGWKEETADKGGFIQEVLKWKPSPLQATVHVPTLLRAAGITS